MIRLLALDLDDTLLRSDLTIGWRTCRVLKKAAKQGLHLVLASGRVPQTMRKFAHWIGMDRPCMEKNSPRNYFICNNGSLISDWPAGNTLWEAKVPLKAAQDVVKLAGAEGFPVQIYEGDKMYLSCSNEYSHYDQNLTGLEQIIVPNFEDFVARGCYKLLIPGDPMLLKPLLTIFRSYLGDEATIFTSKPYFLEILPPGVDKGTALARVAEMEGIDRTEVMAIGDSMNDEAMVAWAGYGVAMANGSDELKKMARIVTSGTNDQDGVAEVVEKYVLSRHLTKNVANAIFIE